MWWKLHLVQEEEQRLRKVALNISKDVKKFWTKIEKLVIFFFSIDLFAGIVFVISIWWSSFHHLLLWYQVLYKHQMELDEKKKKALDKQLEFLLGQTERLIPFFLFFFFHLCFVETGGPTLLFLSFKCILFSGTQQCWQKILWMLINQERIILRSITRMHMEMLLMNLRKVMLVGRETYLWSYKRNHFFLT